MPNIISHWLLNDKSLVMINHLTIEMLLDYMHTTCDEFFGPDCDGLKFEWLYFCPLLEERSNT